jgi:DNA-binding SARP family transcriptional activator
MRQSRSAPGWPGDRAIELSLLGGFELKSNGRTVSVTQAAERLLAFLAIRARPMLRLYVAGTLWAESTEQHAIGNLRSALWRLGQSGHRLIEADADHLRLASFVHVDLYDVTERARKLLNGGAAQEGDFRAIRPAAELLPDHYDEWVLIERERYRQLRMHALEILCVQLTAAGRHGEAVEAGLAAVSGEPLRESAHRVLIRAHLAEGNRCEAIRQFDRYRSVLQRELGLEPSPEIAALVPGSHLSLVATGR